MRSTRVSLAERSYSILVGKELLRETGRLAEKLGLGNRHILVVSQEEVAALYESTLSNSLLKAGLHHSFFIVPHSKSSEAAKTEAVFSKLIRHIASCDGKNRSIALIALGGGVIGDLTGFAASVYRRGVPYIQAPTTLTAQVDSAIGGKTAIDLPEGKNLLGSIYQPALVLSDTSVLASLPGRHWSDGFAEVIKYGVIKDAALFRLLEKEGLEGAKKPKLLEEVIFRCARIKAGVVEKDELDKKGVRIILNFGHTAGHAIEAASSYSARYTHGEAVAIGMLAACDIAEKMGILKEKTLTARLEQTLIKFNLPLFYKGLDRETLMKAMGFDKKAEGGKNRFVLPVSLGSVKTVSPVPSDIISAALEKRRG